MSKRMPPEDKLDPQQKDFLKWLDKCKYAGPNVWVKGFPGSGKSVLLVYAIKKLLNNETTKKSSLVFVVFTHALKDQSEAELLELGISDVNVITIFELWKSTKNYDYIFCDEVQDLTPRMLQKMKESARKMLIVAGDSNQSIFVKDPQFNEPVVQAHQLPQIIGSDDNVGELLYIHRLTSKIIQAVQCMIPSMNIHSAKRDMGRIGTEIRLCSAECMQQEVEYILKEANQFISRNQSCVILLPTHDMILEFCDIAMEINQKPKWERWKDAYYKPYFKKLNEHLSEYGVPLECVLNGYGSLVNAEKDKRIVITTYHSSKGLDFDNVYIPFANENLYIADTDNLAQRLFMVAMTRSKNNLYITYSGTPLEYVKRFSSLCAKIEVQKVLHPEIIGNEIDVDF